MKVVPVRTAKAQLSKLIKEAEASAEIVIARGKKPAVRLVPVAPLPQRFLGSLKGKIWYADETFAPLTEEELRDWGS